MSNRLFRFFLAVSIALVFTGRMEAAANHCRSIAAAMEMADASAGDEMAGMTGCHDAGAPATHDPANQPCECLVLLMADCPALDGPTGTTRIAAFRWDQPVDARLASLERAPVTPPPRA